MKKSMITAVYTAQRTEICIKCNKKWNVSATAIISKSDYICPHCTNRARRKDKFVRRIKDYVLCLSLGMWLGFTPTLFIYADIERGYDATGGEALYPLVPLLVWLFIKTIADEKQKI